MEENYKHNKFYELTSNITSFSHAYLFVVDSLERSLPIVKDFAKKIICSNDYLKKENCTDCNICYLIDNDSFDDLYIINPESIGINSQEIDKLMNYFQTKSLRPDGRRVYIIYGFDRLREDVSNKILKFLEEPEENIHALLMTEKKEKILSTIISRCQIINIKTDKIINDQEMISKMKSFVKFVMKNGYSCIAYVNDYFGDLIDDRDKIYDSFEIIEKILSEEINYLIGTNYDETFVEEYLHQFDLAKIIGVLNITNKLKSLIKRNINLNLLLDRYIIEIVKG